MIAEDRKFLDLDHVCDQIVNQDDRNMFNEAIKCYQIGSHRAAIILSWIVTAECMFRRIDDLANEGDGIAQSARTALNNVKGSVHYEENLISQGQKCELFDDYEEKCLRFARDTRSKCAHPTGVIPSAEIVRSIFHICSQTVLCRDGYRGMSFIRNFIDTKLDDRHLYSGKNRIQEVSRFHFTKVPERIWPQFAECLAGHMQNGASPHWKKNALFFFKVLISDSSDDLATNISQKLQALEAVDRSFFSVFVGIDPRENIWDPHSRAQARAHLRDQLRTGKIDAQYFESYGNLCVSCDFENEDQEFFKERFSLLTEHISKHTPLMDSRCEEILSLILESVKESDYREKFLKAITCLLPSPLFSVESEGIDGFIDELIESDWREDEINNIFLMSSDWGEALKVGLLKKSERYLEECSEDNPEDLLPLFETANSLIASNPTILPPKFEFSINQIIEGQQNSTWFDEKGHTFNRFVGQVDLIRTRHGEYLPILTSLTLPTTGDEDSEDEE